MSPRRAGSTPAAGSRRAASAATVGFEAKLWAAADALRNNMDAAEYKHVVLGLIFLKYVSDAFEAKHAALAAQQPTIGWLVGNRVAAIERDIPVYELHRSRAQWTSQMEPIA